MNIIEFIKSNKCDEADLLEYITDNNVEIAIAAAASPKATGALLDIAARDKDKRVRMAALNNPNIEKRTVETLKKDSDLEISQKAEEVLKGMKL